MSHQRGNKSAGPAVALSRCGGVQEVFESEDAFMFGGFIAYSMSGINLGFVRRD